MRYLITLLTFFVAGTVSAQQYVDLFKLSVGNTEKITFSDLEGTTQISDIDASLTYPVVLNDKIAFLTGVDYTNNGLNLSPTSPSINLQSTTLKLGLSVKHNERFSGTYLLLPKVAGDYKNMSSDDFQFGGIALFSVATKPNFKYKFGVYTTSEEFGMFFVPLLGLYYQGPNKRFEANATLPITYDVNYSLGKYVNLGSDFRAFVRSYALSGDNFADTYAHKNSQEISTYVQFNLLKKSILLQLKGVYSLNDYGQFNQGDQIDYGISALLVGDDRTRLNPDLDNGLGFKIKLIYRFHLEE